MKKAMLISGLITCALLSTSSYAETVLTIKNKTPYLIEISGLVAALATANPIQPNQENATIVAKGDWLGHLMVIQPAAPGYQDNIVMHDVAGKLSVFDLYQRVHVNLENNELTLAR